MLNLLMVAAPLPPPPQWRETTVGSMGGLGTERMTLVAVNGL